MFSLFKRNRRIEPFRRNLHDVLSDRDALIQASNTIENQFIDIVNALESLEHSGIRLTKETESLLNLSQSSDENPVIQTTGLLEPGLNYILTSSQRLKSMIEDLEEHNRKIDHILSIEAELNQTLSQLTYLRTLFRVEAAHLDQRIQVMFMSLVDQIHQLQQSVAGVFKEKFNQLNANRSTIRKTVDRLTKQVTVQFVASNQRRTEIHDALTRMQENLDNSIVLNTSRKESSYEISGSIGKAIIAMQIQDIVSQKLQHIFAAAKDIGEQFEAARESKNKKAIHQGLRYAEKASIILINQIREIRSELKEAENEIQSGLECILRLTSQLEVTKLGNSEKNVQSNEIDGLIANLLNALSDVEGMLVDTESTAKDAYHDILPIKGMASNVTEIISDLSSQLHLIGLNAQVQAAQVVDVSGLEILSSRTSNISIETKTLCQSVSKELDHLVGSLNESVNIFEELYSKGTKQKTLIESTSSEKKEDLQNYLAHFNETTHSIGDLTSKLQQNIRPLMNNLDMESSIFIELSNLEKNLHSLSQEAKRQADRSGAEGDITHLLDNLFNLYTMESERSIHRSSLKNGITEQFESLAENGIQIDLQSPAGNPTPGSFDDFASLEDACGFTIDRNDSQPPEKSSESDFEENVELF